MMIDQDRSPQQTLLSAFRDRLKFIDHSLLELLLERDSVSREVAVDKDRRDEATYQPAQEQKMLDDREAMADEMGIDRVFARALFQLIHDHSVEVQEAMREALEARRSIEVPQA